MILFFYFDLKTALSITEQQCMINDIMYK